MTFSSLATRTSPTPNQDQGRGGSAVTTVVLHHMATTNFEGVLSMWASASRQGSANYAISNRGEVVGVVPEENRSWSLSDYAFDAKSITFEIANEAVGGSWPVSAAAHEATAQVVADVCRRYGIVCNRVNVLGHREVYERYGVSYPTACPGGLNMDGIVARANQIVSEDPFVIKQEEDMHYYRATQPSADGKIAAGYIYVQDATGPLRALDNLQGSYVIELEKQNRVFIAEWLGDDIRGLIERVGIREYLPMPPGAAMATGTPLVGPGKLTERILYSNDTLPDYPLVTIG